MCTSATLGAPASYYWGNAPVAAAASPILIDQAIPVQSNIGLQDPPSAHPVAAVSPVLLSDDSHRQRRQVAQITTEKSTAALASPEFHTSHRIPEHIEADRRQAEEHSFQTAHQIPSHPPLPVVVALHPKVLTTAAPKPAVEVTIGGSTAASIKGHRHRRDDGASAADDVTESVRQHEHVAGLVFPVPVGQIVKHSLAAPEIHQQ